MKAPEQAHGGGFFFFLATWGRGTRGRMHRRRQFIIQLHKYKVTQRKRGGWERKKERKKERKEERKLGRETLQTGESTNGLKNSMENKWGLLWEGFCWLWLWTVTVFFQMRRVHISKHIPIPALLNPWSPRHGRRNQEKWDQCLISNPTFAPGYHYDNSVAINWQVWRLINKMTVWKEPKINEIFSTSTHSFISCTIHVLKTSSSAVALRETTRKKHRL